MASGNHLFRAYTARPNKMNGTDSDPSMFPLLDYYDIVVNKFDGSVNLAYVVALMCSGMDWEYAGVDASGQRMWKLVTHTNDPKTITLSDGTSHSYTGPGFSGSDNLGTAQDKAAAQALFATQNMRSNATAEVQANAVYALLDFLDSGSAAACCQLIMMGSSVSNPLANIMLQLTAEDAPREFEVATATGDVLTTDVLPVQRDVWSDGVATTQMVPSTAVTILYGILQSICVRYATYTGKDWLKGQIALLNKDPEVALPVIQLFEDLSMRYMVALRYLQ
jgi:hypothetical protein